MNRIKFLLSLFLILFWINSSNAQTITNVTVNPTSVCAGSTVTVTFTASSSNGNGNRFDNATVFAPFLSTSAGVFPGTTLTTFTNPSSIPVLPATAANGEVFAITTTITIPSGTTPGTTYKISIGTTATTLPVIAGNATTPTTNKSANFTVVTPAVGGSITGSATVCSGLNSTTFTLSGQTGSVSKWQYATVSDFSSGVVDVVNTTNTLTATNLTATRYYRAVVVSGSCSENSSTGTVTVNPTSVGGTVTGGTTICSGSTSGVLTLAGNTGSIIRWEKAVSPFSSWTTIANTTSTHTSVVLTETTQFRAVVQSGVCAEVNSVTTTVTVNPTSVGGTVTGGTTICSGSTSGLLSLTGNTGSVVRWEKSVSPFSSWTTIANTTSTHTSVALTETTQFRAVVQSGVCAVANSATTTVTVNPTSVGGTVSGGTTICSGSTSGLLSLTGNTGSVVRWEKSVSPFSSWTTIANTTSTHTSVALTETTQFRAVVQSGVCAVANSATTTVTVNTTSVGGTVSGGTTICSGSTSGVLTLTGNTGSVVRWEKSVSPFSSWTTIANTTSTHTSVVLTETTQFRAVVQSGVCAEANSATTTVTVNPTSVGGTVTGGTTICSGSTSGVLTLTGNTGSVVRWEKSVSPFSSWTTIANTTSTHTSVALTETTQFRAVVQSGVCAEANSATTTVTVNPTSVGGTVSGGTTICSGSTSGVLTLTGNTGSVVRWEKSVSPFSSWTTIANTTSTHTSVALTETTQFRAVVQSGVCAEANSATTTVTVNPTSVGGTVSGGTTICSGSTSGVLTLTGNTGSVVRWEKSVSPFSSWTTIANTTSTHTSVALTETTQFRAVVQSGVCAVANSATTTVTVNPTSVGGTVSGGTTICIGSTSGVLTLTGNTGSVVRWESSTSPFLIWTTIANTSNTYTSGALLLNTQFRAVVQSGVCAEANSATTTVTVGAVSQGGTVSGGTTICSGSTSGVLTLTGNTGSVVRWEKSVSPFSSWTTIANTTSTHTSVALTATTQFRAVVQSGVCPEANSATTTVTVNPTSVGGTVSGGTSVCSGSTSGVLTLTGNTGAVVRWEKSVSPFSSWTTIANTTSTHTSVALTETTQFRAVVQSGVCAEANSATTTVSINSTTWDGTSWSPGTPTSTTAVIFTGNYSVASSFDACSVTVTNNAVVSIPSGNSVTISGIITVDSGSTFTLESNANLVQTAAGTNVGSITVKRATSSLKRLDYVLWSTPVTGQELLAFSPQTTATRFYTYDASSNIYVAITPSGNDFAAATGYLIRMPNNHSASGATWLGTFNGVPNNGTHSVSVASGTYNAVGNPYPTTISADDFITDNSLTEALYFWRKTNSAIVTTSSYATYTLAGGAGTSANTGGGSSMTPNGTIQVGQGFIAKATSGSLDFTNSMKTDNHGDQFFRVNSPIERNRIWLNMSGANGVFGQMMVAYMTNATQGIDAAIDGRYINDSPIALNSIIENEEFTIQGRSLPFETTDVVPLGFKTTIAGNYTFAIDHTDGLFLNEDVAIYLKDNATNTVHNLRNGAYSFASETGNFTSRFEIVYQNILGVTQPTFDANSVAVYTQHDNIIVSSNLTDIKQVTVYDLRGRKLLSVDAVNATTTTINASSIANQVLLVKVTSVDGVSITKKIIK